MPLFVDWARDVLENILQAIPNALNPVLIRGIRNKWRDDFNDSSLSANDWEIIQTGNGQAVTVSNSELQISAGTTADAHTIIRCKNKVTFSSRLAFIYRISQRINNQQFYFEIVDSSGNNYARIIFSGTITTSASFEVANNGSSTGITTFTMSVSSLTYSIFEIDLGIEEIKFSTRNVDAGGSRLGTVSRNRRIPDPALEYYLQIRVVNGAAAPLSNTNFFLDSISYQATEILPAEIVGSKGSISGNDAVTVIPPVGQSFQVGGTIASVISSDGANYLLETSTNLTANATFSQARDANGRKFLHVVVETDQPGTLFIEQAFDQATYYVFPGNPCTAGFNVISVELKMRYYRIRYVNGATATTIFKINTTLKTL